LPEQVQFGGLTIEKLRRIDADEAAVPETIPQLLR